MNKKIWLSSPHMGTEEIKFIQQAFDENWVAPVGPHINAFEKELASYNKIGHCAALSSGTAAIHLALIMLGIRQGDEVLCSTFTFSGSCNPIAYEKAVPVFIDSEPATWNMDPALLEEAIVDRIKKKGTAPKALIIVHLYGMPAKMNELMRIAGHYGIPVIEDAAEALGSTYNGQKLGTFGEIGIYSFNGNKIITTSGGGALVSNNEKWVSKAKFLSTQARDEAPHYEHTHIGYNYRLSNICAAIGRGQLRVLDERVQQRRRVFETYRENLNSGVFSLVSELQGMFSNRWLTTALIHAEASFTPEKLRTALAQHEIETRPLWKPMHLQPVFKDAPAYSNGVSEKLFRTGICLPSGSNLTTEDQSRVLDEIKRVTEAAVWA
jgi:dTDP-4-amino-4,6-dideoxygalactose transaminase